MLTDQQNLFTTQPPEIQAHLDIQAGSLEQALATGSDLLQFTLPERIAGLVGCGDIPEAERQQQVHSKNGSQAEALFQCFQKLEHSTHPSVAASTGLLCWATARRLFFAALQAKRPLAFDEQGGLVAESLEQARGRVAALQDDFKKLVWAFRLSPEMDADDEYWRDRERLLRQLFHQGCSLASLETQSIIGTIKQLAQANRLNRGLSLSLPYFDDRALRTKMYNFEVIPPGRILFEGYYVMWAARYEEERVQQDPGLSPGSRRQLLAGLKALEHAFDVPGLPPHRPARKKTQIRTRLAALRLVLSTFAAITIKKDRNF